MPYTYDYPRPMLTADCAVFKVEEGALKVLLIERGDDPDKGKWALPGGFVEIDEDIPQGAARELREETGLTGVDLAEVGVFGRPGRDPRGRVVTVAYVGLVHRSTRPAAGDDAAKAGFHDVAAPPPLAFDHAEVLARSTERLVASGRVAYGPGGWREA